MPQLFEETEEERRRRLGGDVATLPPTPSTAGSSTARVPLSPLPEGWEGSNFNAFLDWSGYYDLYKQKFDAAGVSREQAIDMGNIYGKGPVAFGFPQGWAGPTSEWLDVAFKDYPAEIRQLVDQTIGSGFYNVGGQAAQASGPYNSGGYVPVGATSGGGTGDTTGGIPDLPNVTVSGTIDQLGGQVELATQWALAKGISPDAGWLWKIDGKQEVEDKLNDIIAYLKTIDASAVGDASGYAPGQVAPPGMPDDVAASYGLIPRSEAEQYTQELASITPPGWKWVIKDGQRLLKSPDGETHTLEEVANNPIWGNYVRAGLGISVKTETGWKMLGNGEYESPEGIVYDYDEMLFLAFPELRNISLEEFEEIQATEAEDLYKTQIQTEARDILEKLFPSEKIEAIAQRMSTEEGLIGFLMDIREIGRTTQTEQLLKYLWALVDDTITDNEMRWVFNEPQLPSIEQFVDYYNNNLWPWEKKADVNADWFKKEYEAFIDEFSGYDLLERMIVASGGQLSASVGQLVKWFGDTLPGETNPILTFGEQMIDHGMTLNMVAIDTTHFEGFKPEYLLDAEWWAGNIGQQVLPQIPLLLTGMAGISFASGIAVGYGITSTFGKVALTGLGYSAFAAPYESLLEGAQAFDQAIAGGATLEEAAKVKDEVFWNNLKMLGISNIFEAGAAFSPFKFTLRSTAGAITRGLISTTTIGGKVFITGLTNAGQEVYQQYVTNKALGDDTFVMDDEMQTVAAVGFIFGGAFGGIGQVYNAFNAFKNKVIANLNPKVRDAFETAKQESLDAGNNPETADWDGLNSASEQFPKEVAVTVGLVKEEITIDTTAQILGVSEATSPTVTSHVPTEQGVGESLVSPLETTLESLISSLTSQSVTLENELSKAKAAGIPTNIEERKARTVNIQQLEKELKDNTDRIAELRKAPPAPISSKNVSPKQQIVNKNLVKKLNDNLATRKAEAGIEVRQAEAQIIAEVKAETIAEDVVMQWRGPIGYSQRTIKNKEGVQTQTNVPVTRNITYFLNRPGQPGWPENITVKEAQFFAEGSRGYTGSLITSGPNAGKVDFAEAMGEWAERNFNMTSEELKTHVENIIRGHGPGTPKVSLITEGTNPKAEIKERAKELVKQNKPGAVTNLLRRLPLLKQLMEFERPGLQMENENTVVLESWVAARAAKIDVLTKANMSEQRVFKTLAEVFGKQSLYGKPANVKFIGTAEEAKSVLTNTLKDGADNPQLYDLSLRQKAALADLEVRNFILLDYVVEGYNAEIGKWEAQLEGAYLPNVDISEDAIEMVGSERGALSRGRSKTRVWKSARERMAHDPTFKPELNVIKMINAIDHFKANAAASITFREVLGGKTKLEVLQELHPNLYNKMMGLRKKLASLRGSKTRLEQKAVDAIEGFESSGFETEDIDNLLSALELETGARKGLGVEDIKVQIDSVLSELKELRPGWQAANTKPYVQVQGVFRYFKAPQANLIKELLKTHNNHFLTLMEMIRGTAFSGDLSPILGVQTPLGVLFDPLGSLRNAAGAIVRSIQEGDILRSFKMDKFLEDVNAGYQEWSEFFTLIGRAPSGTPSEFAGGFLSKLPGFSAFTESTFLMVTRQQFLMWQRLTDSLVKSGASPLTAKVAAAMKVTEVFPLLNETLLGQSEARHQEIRSLPTSYSFIRQPMRMMADAANGIIKTATFQKLSPKEQLSLRLMIQFSTSVMFIAVMSAILDALKRGDDPWDAAWDVINPDPENGKFASIILNDKLRIPIGGPYRALFRAIWPQEVTGSPVPVPFAGLFNFFKNRTNPVISVTTDLIANEDYYGRKIRELKPEDTDIENFLRNIEYGLENFLPLSLGAVIEDLRTDNHDKIVQDFLSQFAGFNLTEMGKVSTTDDLISKLGVLQPSEGDDASASPDHYYNLKDLWTDLNYKMKYVKPEDIKEVKGYDPIVVSWYEAKTLYETTDKMVSEPLKDVSYKNLVQYRDDGKITQSEYALLIEYNSLTSQSKKDAFLKSHPELTKDPRNEYLVSNPKENALLALWGKERLTTVEAYNEALKLAGSLGIPEKALTLVPSKPVEKGYLAYLEAQSKYTGANFGNTTAAQNLRKQYPELDAWGNVFLGWDKFYTPEAQKIYDEMTSAGQNTSSGVNNLDIRNTSSSANYPYPREADVNLGNIDDVVSTWMQNYYVPEEWRDKWESVNVDKPNNTFKFGPFKWNVEQGSFWSKVFGYHQEKAAGWSYRNNPTIKLTENFLNPGVLAHEMAHQQWDYLAATQRKAFETSLNNLKESSDLIRDASSSSGIQEWYADIYRLYGPWMPNELKQFYPQLIPKGFSEVTGNKLKYSPEVESGLEDLTGLGEDVADADHWLQSFGFTREQSAHFLDLYSKGKLGQSLEEVIKHTYLQWIVDGFTPEEIFKEMQNAA